MHINISCRISGMFSPQTSQVFETGEVFTDERAIGIRPIVVQEITNFPIPLSRSRPDAKYE